MNIYIYIYIYVYLYIYHIIVILLSLSLAVVRFGFIPQHGSLCLRFKIHSLTNWMLILWTLFPVHEYFWMAEQLLGSNRLKCCSLSLLFFLLLLLWGDTGSPPGSDPCWGVFPDVWSVALPCVCVCVCVSVCVCVCVCVCECLFWSVTHTSCA